MTEVQAIQTTQERSEARFTQREKGLAKHFQVKPGFIHEALTESAQELLKALAKELPEPPKAEEPAEPEQRSEEEQNEREQLLDVIANLTREEVHELTKQVKADHADIVAELDAEAEQPDEPEQELVELNLQTVEPEGDPMLATVKRWLAKRTYTEKLSGVLISELLKRDGSFTEADKYCGNDVLRKWETEVTKKATDPAYLKSAEPDEAAVSVTTAVWIPQEV